MERKRRSLESKRKNLKAKIAAMRAELENESQELAKSVLEDERREQVRTDRGTANGRRST